ncbi:hypothetical protein [Thalassotalea castellviae]|uniref:Cell wall polymerase n=1 Tax=Thalassotalea castellviae TaxID=3075612 RepID=A0ABU3A2A8_9GAMM|nr:hypothetical protein [Thalassotalea sp. W431]MDT0604316.1 hypothetical protein [Thalassotalea sp. W431]
MQNNFLPYRIAFFLLAIVAFGFVFYQLPQVYQLEQVVLGAKAQVVGEKELHSPQMSTKHIRIEDKGEEIKLKDVSSTRKLLVKFQGKTVNASGIVINNATELLFGDSLLKLKPVMNGLEIAYGEKSFVYNINGLAQVEPEALSFEYCRDLPYLSGSLEQSLITWLLKLKPNALSQLAIGGDVLCKTRLAISESPYINGTISLIKQHFVLHSSTPESLFIKELGGEWKSLSSYAINTSGEFIAGRTEYKITRNVDNEAQYLVEVESKKPQRLTSPELTTEKWTAVLGQSPKFNGISQALLLFSACMLIAALYWKKVFRFNRYQPTGLNLYFFSILGLCIISLHQLDMMALPLEWQVGLLVVAMSLLLERWWHYALAFVVLVGVFSQLLLGVNAPIDTLLIKAQQQIVILSVFCFVVGLVKGLNIDCFQQILAVIKNNHWFWLVVKYGLVLVYCLLLLNQFFSGSETGIPNFVNPTEMIKLVMALVAAIFIGSLSLYHGKGLLPQLIKLFVAGLVFIIFALLFLASIKDFSPVIILSAMLLAITVVLVIIFLTREKAQSRQFGYFIIVIACAAIFTTHYWVAKQIDELSMDTYQLSLLPAVDRWKSLKYPEQNYINAYQINEAKRVQVTEQLSGISNWNKRVAVPAIQDDLSLTHLIVRTGWLFSTFFVGMFVGLASYLFLTSCQVILLSIKFTGLLIVKQEVIQLAIFCTLMSAALLAHIIINIGSNLGVIPLMGQPLAFLSIANSHLLTFVIPTIVTFTMLQKQQVRVMS